MIDNEGCGGVLLGSHLRIHYVGTEEDHDNIAGTANSNLMNTNFL
jgi:hypothetical protein